MKTCRVMPAALVPRSWDFEDPPANQPTRPKAVVQLSTSLPGTEVIVEAGPSALQHPSTPPTPMVTLSPPTLADALVGTE